NPSGGSCVQSYKKDGNFKSLEKCRTDWRPFSWPRIWNRTSFLSISVCRVWMEWKPPNEFERWFQTQFFCSLAWSLLRKLYKRVFVWEAEATFKNNLSTAICCLLSMQFLKASDSLGRRRSLAMILRPKLRTGTRFSSVPTMRCF